MATYQKSEDRRKDILKKACRLAEKSHYKNLRRDKIAKACNTAPGNISRIMGDMESLRWDVIDYALNKSKTVVIAQAVIDKHPAVKHLSKETRRQVLASMV